MQWEPPPLQMCRVCPRCLEPVQKLGRTGCSFISDLFLSQLNRRFCFLPLPDGVRGGSGCPRGSALWLQGKQLLCCFQLPKVLWIRLIPWKSWFVCHHPLPETGRQKPAWQEGVSAGDVMWVGSEGLCWSDVHLGERKLRIFVLLLPGCCWVC